MKTITMATRTNYRANSEKDLPVVEESNEIWRNLDSIVQNMSIVHEMAVDPNFKLQQVSPESIVGHVKKIVHQAFWDVLQEEINANPPNYGQAIRLIAEIKEALLSLTFDHNVNLRATIESILDVELIQQQSEQQCVDIAGYTRFIIETMTKICVPARDKDVENLSNVEGGLVPLFREIFCVLDLMKLDMANYKLSLLRPRLMQQAIEYERQKFKELLHVNPNGLQLTKLWIKSGIAHDRSLYSSTNVYKQGHSGDGCSSQETFVLCKGANKTSRLVDICRHCYALLMLEKENISFPETLLMDRERMMKLRLTCEYLISLSSIMSITLNIITGTHLTTDVEYITSVKNSTALLLQASDDADKYVNISLQIIKETNSFLTKRGLHCLNEDKEGSVKLQLSSLGNSTNTITEIVRTRMYSYFMDTLLCEPSNRFAKVPAIFKIVENELIDFTKKFLALTSHNYKVFHTFYGEIVQNSENVQ